MNLHDDGAVVIVSRMGKKLTAASKRPPSGLRGQFTRHFREAVKGRNVVDVADLLGVTPGMVRQYIGGDKMPEINSLPSIAKKLGLANWQELFDKP